MDGYKIVSVHDMLEAFEEEKILRILSSFCCPLNNDVETFVRSKSIQFARQGITETYLIFTSYRSELVLAAYFSLATKVVCVERKAVSRALADRLKRFAIYDAELRRYTLSMPLIAQLGKNHTYRDCGLITGDEILKLACDTVKAAQRLVGGRFVYLECEDISKLTDFYGNNGFCNFGKRRLDKDETADYSGSYLIQMLKYLAD